MLLRKYSRGEGSHIVAFQHRHGFLQNDWAVVQMLIDEMHRAARHFHAIFQRLFLRVHAGERRQ